MREMSLSLLTGSWPFLSWPGPTAVQETLHSIGSHPAEAEPVGSRVPGPAAPERDGNFRISTCVSSCPLLWGYQKGEQQRTEVPRHTDLAGVTPEVAAREGGAGRDT